MKKIKHFLASRLSPGEAGQALILVLIFLALGSLTLVPTLIHINTALKTGEIYEENTNELYTADSGIEDGLWRIKYDFMGTDYNPYDFDTAFPYQTEDLNGMMANFTIKNVWFPTDAQFTDPGAPGYIDMSPDDIMEMMESEKLVVSGSALPGQPYRILIDFSPDAGDNLTIKSLGVWLPGDFTYTANSCSLQVDGEIYEPDDITITEVPGGHAIVWSYDSPYPYISDFPGFDDIEMDFGFTFEYTPPIDHPSWRPAAIAWVTTEMQDEFGNPKYPLNTPENVPVSWDIDTRYFKIVSEAGDTAIDAYTSKNELRQMGDAMSGDYAAIGNSLLADDDGDDKRDDWHTPSSYTLDSIPDDADAVYALLYWAGWRNQDAVEGVFYENCSDFNEWDRVMPEPQNQTRVPTGDGYTYGTWNSSPYWSKVDETTPNDADYITGVATSGWWPSYAYKYFTFSSFLMPSYSTIESLTVYFRAKDVSGGTNNLCASLRVGGNRYNASASVDPTTDWTTYSYTWDYNPATGNPWTWQEINGGSSNPLQQFGVYSTDLNPDIQISMVYAQVLYCETCWIVSSGEFRGHPTGMSDPPPSKILTLKNGLNLDSYGSGFFNISWEQDESGNLSEDDTFYFAFSGDGGDTWSSYYVAFSGNDPVSPFSYPIPEEYITDDFKIRFYFNFNSSSEFVYLDNIKITHLPVDTEVTFKINDQQVYLDGSDPATGFYPVTAGRSYAMLNTMWGADYGFSYACVRDVSALVKTYPIDPDEEHHTGNAKYTVDGVSADTRNPNGSLSDFAFAGWSLIIVYASPETAGHYIYIRDDNFAFHPGTGGNLDFDNDPSYEGGIINGFKIPNPITDAHGEIIETVAAKLTCFVVEGDDFFNDTSSIIVTGQQSEVSKSLTNPSCEIDDIWNGQSYPGTFNEGVDIDTFELKWDDGVLTPKDTELKVDLYSLNDAWNLVYFIISIRSETVTSGTSYYTIRGS